MNAPKVNQKAFKKVYWFSYLKFQKGVLVLVSEIVNGLLLIPDGNGYELHYEDDQMLIIRQ